MQLERPGLIRPEMPPAGPPLGSPDSVGLAGVRIGHYHQKRHHPGVGNRLAIRTLHHGEIRHAHLSLGKLLLTTAVDCRPEVSFIDLDTSRLREWRSPAMGMRNLLRLHRSVRKIGGGLKKIERFRFFRADSVVDRAEARKVMTSFSLYVPMLKLHQLLWNLSG